MNAVELMELLRDEGWCVVLKCLPKDMPWIIEGSRSEYDAPSPDRKCFANKWCCELNWLGKGKYRNRIDAFGDTADEAVTRAHGRAIEQDARHRRIAK